VARTWSITSAGDEAFTSTATASALCRPWAAQFLAGLNTLAMDCGTSNLDAATRKSVLASLAAARKPLATHDQKGPGALLDAQELARASGNALFVGPEEPLSVRVNLLRVRDADAYWDALVAVADEPEAAFRWAIQRAGVITGPRK
jgi:hypothetical protein